MKLSSNNYFISIVIPVYKVEDFITDCLESIISEAHTNLQVILVDDGSPDTCGQICDDYQKKYPELITVIHQKNQGLSMARNNGMEIAQGEYVFFVDSDDSLKKGWYDTLTSKLKEYNYPDMLCFDFESWSPQEGILHCEVIHQPKYDCVLNTKQDSSIMILGHSSWSRIVKKSIYIDNDILFPKGLYYEDLATTPKLLTCCNSVVYINNILYRYTIRSGSIMNSPNIDNYKHYIKVFDNLIAWFNKKDKLKTYETEFTYLAICNILSTPSKPIILSSATNKYQLLDTLLNYVNVNFPNWQNNPNIKSITAKNRLILFLRKKRAYSLLNFMWKLYDIFLHRKTYNK